MLPTDGKETITVESARPAPLICPPCGIRFSSASTLEAHQTFYCAHRPRLEDDAANNDEDEEKSGKFDVRKAYACPHCSYSADKKVSLNRHMRMHAASPVPPAVPPASTTPVGNSGSVTPAANGSLNEEAERYCRNCDIRSAFFQNILPIIYLYKIKVLSCIGVVTEQNKLITVTT